MRGRTNIAPALVAMNAPLSSPVNPQRLPRILLAAWALLWAGVIVGMSFLATPIKFTAPALTLPVALQVGMVTFVLLQKVNWVALLVSAVLVWLAQSKSAKALWLVLLILEIFIDSVVLPPLNARVALYFGTAPIPPGTWHHAAYGIIEVARVLLLLLLAFVCLRQAMRNDSAAAPA